MADLRERFNGLDQIEVPDLRSAIEQRAKQPTIQLEPTPTRATVSRGVLVAAAAGIAVLVLIGAITLLTSSERDQVEPAQTTTTLSPPRPGMVQNPDNGHFYEAVIESGGFEWDTARAESESRSFRGVQGHLVTITSEQEDRFVREIISEQLPSGPWLGGFQPEGSEEPGGGWQWVTGEPFEYTNWGPVEPNEDGDEECLQYLPEGWNDFPCQAGEVIYIVEYDITRDSPADAFPSSNDFGDGGFLEMSSGVPGDNGGPRLTLGAIGTIPNNARMDFLFELCDDTTSCQRDAAFIHPSGEAGVGPWIGSMPFHIRHGFVNRNAEPLGPDFDVKVLIISLEETDPENRSNPDSGHPLQLDFEVVYEFTSDYVVRGSSDRCGPTYRTQQGSEPCEWFVHDFPEGLPPGRYEFMVVWQAPCWAWLQMGATDACTDPAEVQELFWAPVNSPFYDFEWQGFLRQPNPSPWDHFELNNDHFRD